MSRPDPTEYAAYYGKYLALVPEEDVLAAMQAQWVKTLAVLGACPEEEANARHRPYTWTVKQVVGHLTDSERVFGYRALRVARGDATPLPGFDENAFAAAGDFDRRTLSDLAAEFEAVRRSHLLLFGSLPDAAWVRRGVANGSEISVRAIAYIIVGHERHHAGILRKRLAHV
jgi:hypothetical protein